MERRDAIGQKLDELFQLDAFPADPAFSRFIPMVYNPISFDWKSAFTEEFVKKFNGFMLKGSETVHNVFLAVFPTEEVLQRFIDEASEGDLLFMHHPLVMEYGDPRGEWGRGVLPIPVPYIEELKKRKLSVYTCHIPMDYHEEYGTNIAIVKGLNGRITERFVTDEYGSAGVICEIDRTPLPDLIEQLKALFDIPYVDVEGKDIEYAERLAVVAGCGDKVALLEEAERLGAQVYISGQIHSHIDNEYGRYRYDLIQDYIEMTGMKLIGVSHAASEYLVKRTLMSDWFRQHFNVNVVLLPQKKWWL
ncbi:MAG: Nif3-like dinuclear metal center hexameric protein [Ectobacillus sp.]